MSDPPLVLGRRIVVSGLAGSGKSTFSLALGAKTGLPVIHLDLEFWNPGWTEPSELEWRERQSRVLAGDAWIADGNYHATLDLRLERGDTAVVLDMPWWQCAGRALLRGLRMPDQLPEGCEYSRWQRLRDEWSLAVRIWRQRHSEPERERQIIAQHGRHATVHVLRSKRATAEFLDSIDDGGPHDGVVSLRPFEPREAPLIVAGRDAAFRRFIGEGSAVPSPEFCIVADGSVVGWIDHDRDDDRWWLAPEDVNIGYHVFPEHRGRGYATRAVHLMLVHLREDTEHHTATLLIHPDNVPSLTVAERNGFERATDVDGRTLWRRPVAGDR